MPDGAHISNYILAGGTLLAATFVAVQAWYARTSFLEGAATRLQEQKLEICFENFDEAAALDAALRLAVPGMAEQDWPPSVVVEDAAGLVRLQRTVIPKLDALEAGLTKASVLGPLDKYRGFMQQQVRGLSKGLFDLRSEALTPENEDTAQLLAQLSDFIGAQYLVFTGCREVAEGTG